MPGVYLSHWRDEINTRWVNWRDVIEALDRVLITGGFPGLELEQPKPVEDALSPTARLTVPLRIDAGKHDSPAQIFVFVTAEEITKVRNTHDGIDLLLKQKIAETSFTEIHGNVIRTYMHRDRNGVWIAMTVDGTMWEFNEEQNHWIKGPISL